MTSIKFLVNVIFLFVLNHVAIMAAELKESRAIFDPTYSWETPAGAKRTLERIKRAGFNVYIPRVWLGDGVFWTTKLAPKSPKWKYMPSVDYDPLANLISEAHRMGIEVHPWFTVMNRWREFYPEFYGKGISPHSFNVHKPEFRKFIVDLMLDVVKKYDVDGVNLDVIRSKGFCVSEFCENDYKVKLNRDLLSDVKLYKETNHFKVEKTKEWSYLMRWNYDAVTDIVKTFSVKAKAIKPKLIISVDTIVLIEGFRIQGADGLKWKNDGLIDIIFQMDYKKKLSLSLIKKARKRLKKPDSLILLVGNVNWPNNDTKRGKEAFSRSGKLTAEVLNVARSNGKGVAMWSYEFLTGEQVLDIKNGPFKQAAKPFWSF